MAVLLFGSKFVKINDLLLCSSSTMSMKERSRCFWSMRLPKCAPLLVLWIR